jgi:NADH-quinone oxidoreductase subunit L
MILESVFAAHYNKLFFVGVVAAFFTACYSIKLIILVFHGESKLSISSLNKVHESPAVMLAPLSILACGSIFSGVYGYHMLGIGEVNGYFVGILFLNEHHLSVPFEIEMLPLAIGVLGIIFSFVIFRKNYWVILAERLGVLSKLTVNKYYFDEIYDYCLVGLVNIFAKTCNFVDQSVIDRFGPVAVINLVKRLTNVTRQMQSGYIFNYALFMLIGLLMMMSYFLLSYNNWIL